MVKPNGHVRLVDGPLKENDDTSLSHALPKSEDRLMKKTRFAAVLLLILSGSVMGFSVHAEEDQVLASVTTQCKSAHDIKMCLIKNVPDLARLHQEMEAAFEKRLSTLDEETKGPFRAEHDHMLEIHGRLCSKFARKEAAEQKMLSMIDCWEKGFIGFKEYLEAHCEPDPEHTVEELASRKNKTHGKIPVGFRIDDHVVAYAVPNTSPSYELPLDPAGISGGLHYGYKDIAICRVQDPAGQWWLVSKAGPILEYVREKDTVTQAEYAHPKAAAKMHQDAR